MPLRDVRFVTCVDYALLLKLRVLSPVIVAATERDEDRLLVNGKRQILLVIRERSTAIYG